MSVKLWIKDAMYLVDEPVQEYIEKLESQNDRLLEMLKDIEFVWNVDVDRYLCPRCDGRQNLGHEKDCSLGQLLKECEK